MSKKNIFAERNSFVQKPNRNTFDLSFQNNLTMEFGKLYPVFCKEVLPGDSFRIKPTFALRTLPMHFPVQTRMQVNLHFFYVRNRNLWSNWPNFIGNIGDNSNADHDLIPPYIAHFNSGSRSLADYLGVPTTLYGGIGSNLLNAQSYSSFKNGDKQVSILRIADNFSSAYHMSLDDYNKFRLGTSFKFEQSYETPTNVIPVPRFKSIHLDLNPLLTNDVSRRPTKFSIYACLDDGHLIKFGPADSDAALVWDIPIPADNKISYELPEDIVNKIKADPLVTSFLLIFDIKNENVQLENRTSNFKNVNIGNFVPILDSDLNVAPLEYGQLPKKPFGENGIHISALPFRAYESIYNAFYRNQLNDPLLNSDRYPVYNEYLLDNSGGRDTFDYHLHYRNWELDYLTSAVQSPQQGIAPLVGVSMNGDFTFSNKNDDGSTSYFHAKANIDSNNKITGFQLSNKTDVDSESSLENVPDSVKQGTIYNLNQMALAGISINDFRNVNSLQRWLETNIRRGYRYKDQLMSHFGVDAKYEELDMPEFLGGMSEPIYINSISETSQADGGTLGDYAGQGSVMATSDHSIEHYCDEHGFIMGILSISPVPNYSQLLPKMFIKSNYLDYFFPEFGHIGLQPIDYREVCPLQAAQEDIDLTKVFGYQRPWYDYIASVDEVHGEFRTDLRNFLCNRQFSNIPRLNHDFLKVDPSQLNDIFSVTDTTDKILGQIYFDVSAKRPIPRMGIPRLE